MTNENNTIYTYTKKPLVEGKCGEFDVRFIDESSEKTLDDMITKIVDYISNNNAKGESEEYKDELYSNAQVLLKEYSDKLGTTKFSLNILPEAVTFIHDFIMNEAEYNVENVFVGLEVKKYLESIIGFINPEGFVVIPLDPTSMTYMYHIISAWKKVGWSKETDTFVGIITAFGQISTLIKYYDAYVQNLRDDITSWALSFEEGINIE